MHVSLMNAVSPEYITYFHIIMIIIIIMMNITIIIMIIRRINR